MALQFCLVQTSMCLRKSTTKYQIERKKKVLIEHALSDFFLVFFYPSKHHIDVTQIGTFLPDSSLTPSNFRIHNPHRILAQLMLFP